MDNARYGKLWSSPELLEIKENSAVSMVVAYMVQLKSSAKINNLLVQQMTINIALGMAGIVLKRRNCWSLEIICDEKWNFFFVQVFFCCTWYSRRFFLCKACTIHPDPVCSG
jgi:hypothetical protein